MFSAVSMLEDSLRVFILFFDRILMAVAIGGNHRARFVALVRPLSLTQICQIGLD